MEPSSAPGAPGRAGEEVLAGSVRGRPEASALIWNRGELKAPGAAPPSAGRLRTRGVLQAAVGLTAGTLLWLYGPRVMAYVVLGIASLVMLSALLSPAGAFMALERMFGALGRPLGRATTWILLVPLFYLFFYPFGRLFRRGRRDLLRRYRDPETTTYWEPHEGKTAASGSLEKQF